jgi:hypothetical protein
VKFIKLFSARVHNFHNNAQYSGKENKLELYPLPRKTALEMRITDYLIKELKLNSYGCGQLKIVVVLVFNVVDH